VNDYLTRLRAAIEAGMPCLVVGYATRVVDTRTNDANAAAIMLAGAELKGWTIQHLTNGVRLTPPDRFTMEER
jgi:hypothetical protein